MPRVMTKTKNRAGADRACGKCGEPIRPGEKYRTWSFRYGGTYFRCNRAACAPRASELTQSIIGEVYSAQEAFEDSVTAESTVAEIKEAVEAVRDAAQEVADQYREAAEPFGGAGENGERADELEGWIGDLDGFYPDEEPDGVSEEAREAIEEKMRADGFTEEDEPEWQSVLEVRLEELGEDTEAIAAAREAAFEEAQELVGGCPL
jgi:hypothetical protein